MIGLGFLNRPRALESLCGREFDEPGIDRCKPLWKLGSNPIPYRLLALLLKFCSILLCLDCRDWPGSVNNFSRLRAAVGLVCKWFFFAPFKVEPKSFLFCFIEPQL